MWRRVGIAVRVLLGSVACMVLALGGVFAIVPEGQGARAISIFDIDDQPAGREPVPLDAGRSVGDGWVFVERASFARYMVIDITSCEEMLSFYAFAGLPWVHDRFVGRGGDEPFVSIWSFDYGHGDVAERRLAPIADPVRGCAALDQWFHGDVEPIGVPASDGLHAFAYRINTRVTAVVSDRDGRVIFIEGARIPDGGVIDLVARAAEQLAAQRDAGVRGPVATVPPALPVAARPTLD